MAFNENLANRVREMLAHETDLEEKLMFRSLTFMVNGKMCICVGTDSLLCRIDPALAESLLETHGVRQMVHNGRAMKGYVYVEEAAVRSKKELAYWLQLCLAYNSIAKSSKKQKKART